MCTHFLVDRRVAEVYSGKAGAVQIMPEAGVLTGDVRATVPSGLGHSRNQRREM